MGGFKVEGVLANMGCARCGMNMSWPKMYTVLYAWSKKKGTSSKVQCGVRRREQAASFSGRCIL